MTFSKNVTAVLSTIPITWNGVDQISVNTQAPVTWHNLAVA
jgi:hypothetical protein